MLHDFGKVGVRENVLVKATKLEPLELENLRGRFETIYVQEELQAEREKVQILLRAPADEARHRLAQGDARLAERKRELCGVVQLAAPCQRPTLLPESTLDPLHRNAR